MTYPQATPRVRGAGLLDADENAERLRAVAVRL
jgi:hypothetical protein